MQGQVEHDHWQEILAPHWSEHLSNIFSSVRPVVVTTAEAESDSEPPELIDQSTDDSSNESEDSDSDADALAGQRIEGKQTVPDYSLRPGSMPHPPKLPKKLPKLPKLQKA